MDKPRLLVVDDEKSIRELLTSCLTDRGYAVTTAADGAEALELVLAQDFNLVITDVMMPRLGGLDFLRSVKKSRPGLPVIIITGYATTDITIQALKLGAVDFITKPFRLSDIFHTVQKILEHQERQQGIQNAFSHMVESRRRFECASRDLNPDAVLQVLARDLVDMGFCHPMNAMKLSLAVKEAIDNAIEHGNLELPSGHKQKEYMIDPMAFHRWKTQRLQDPKFGDRRIEIDLALSPRELRVSVRDEGTGFDTSRLPATVDKLEVLDAELHGFNLMMLSMDEVRYNEKGNEVVLIKHRNNHEAE